MNSGRFSPNKPPLVEELEGMPVLFGKTLVPSSCWNTQPPPWELPPCLTVAGPRGLWLSPLCDASCCRIGRRVCARAPPAGLVSWERHRVHSPKSKASLICLTPRPGSHCPLGDGACPTLLGQNRPHRPGWLWALFENLLSLSISGLQTFFLSNSPSAAPSREGGP